MMIYHFKQMLLCFRIVAFINQSITLISIVIAFPFRFPFLKFTLSFFGFKERYDVRQHGIHNGFQHMLWNADRAFAAAQYVN